MPDRTTLRRFLVGAKALIAMCLFSATWAGATTTTVDFDIYAGGTTLTSQEAGVTFPSPGVRVVGRGDARSAPNVGIGPPFDEFQRHPFRAVFDGDQKMVELWVKPESGNAPASTAYLRAYNSSDVFVDSDSVSMSGGSGWQRLAVGSSSGSPQIRRVVVKDYQGSFETNFVMVDDLEAFSDDPLPPPPPADTTPPTVEIVEPTDMQTFNSRAGTLRVTASDDEDLFEVKGGIVHGPSSTRVADVDGCGPTSFYGACSLSLDRTHGFELDEGLQGPHTVSVEACDASGNCATDSVGIRFELSDPPASVEAWWIELNQSVQGTPPQAFDFAPGNDTTYGGSQVELISLKDTVVRFYLLGDGGNRNEFTASLRLAVHNGDGSVDHHFIAPNAGATTVDVVAKPATPEDRRAEMKRMRSDLSRTLNFVLPSLLIDEATRLELELDRVSGTITVPLDGPNRMNVVFTPVRTPDTDGTNAGRPADGWFSRIDPYLEQVMPAWVRAGATAPLQIGAGVQTLCELVSSPCNCALWQLSMTDFLSPDDPIFTDPGGAYGERPISVRVGVVDFGALSGAAGCAYLGDPSDPNSRRYAPAITEAWGDVAAHEIGHALGLMHASNSHRESTGGSAEVDWPYEDGTIGLNNYGVVLERVADLDPDSPGSWEITLIDTCPGITGTARSDCPLDDTRQAHDFMSYGDSDTDLGPLSANAARNFWVSDITYSRIYNAIQFDRVPAYMVERSTHERSPSVVISGSVDEDGTVELLPTLRREQFTSVLEVDSTGSYSVELLDAAGGLLAERSFEPLELADGGDPHRFFMQELPDEPDLHRVAVRKDGVEVAARTASSNPPTVRVLAPDGGEIVSDGNVTIRWQAHDADGDALTLFVEMSTDEGDSWQTVASRGPGDPSVLRLPVGTFEPTRRALVRVRASDGLLGGQDRSDCTFSLNTEETPQCASPEPDPEPEPEDDPEPPSSDFFVSPAFPEFGFQVRITGGTDPITGTFEPLCIDETLCVSGAVPGRSEVFLRIVGPKPNGNLWPTLVKFSTATVEVWIKQHATGLVRYYELEGARPGFDALPGLFDRDGFAPGGGSAPLASRGETVAGAAAGAPVVQKEAPPLPSGPYMTSPQLPDFRFKVRIRSAGGDVRPVRQESACIDETICVSGALPGRSEVFLRIVGPKPNGHLWPTLVKFTTSEVEIWIEQISTGALQYYQLAGARPGVDELPGLFDRTGFLP